MRSVLVVLVFLSPQLAAAECICLNRGVEVSEGKTACIQTSQGGRLALCEKNLNVTNWKFLGEGCLVAGVEGEKKAGEVVAFQ